MDDSGSARIADFVFANVTQDLDSMRSTQGQRGFTPRWTAPEVLDKGPSSKEADIFSFAMVMIEVRRQLLTVHRALAHYHFVSIQVFTGAIPFSGKPAAMAMLDVMQGRRPPRPTHPTFTENLWTLMQRCWDHDPHLRPEVSEVLQVLLTPSVSRPFQQLYICQLDCLVPSTLPPSPPIHRLASNRSHDSVGLPTTHSENGHPVSSHSYSPSITSPIIHPDDGNLPAPPQPGTSKEGRVGRLVRNARRVFKAIT